MNRTRTVSIYLFFDLLSACLAWQWLSGLAWAAGNRAAHLTPVTGGLLLFWLSIYSVSGYYNNIFRKSRLQELGQTLFTSFVGMSLVFGVVLPGSPDETGHFHPALFLSALALHFGLTYFFRLVHTSIIAHRIHHRKIGFNTLLIGGGIQAVQCYSSCENEPKASGNRFVGFVRFPGEENPPLEHYLPCLGEMDDIPRLVESRQVVDVIVSSNSSNHQLISQILIKLNLFQVTVWGIPDLYDILSGTAKGNQLYRQPLFKISNGVMPVWAANIKRLADVLISAAALLLLLPLSFVLIALIRFGSPGPIIYAQERIGRFGKAFRIYKFRSMFANAEIDGPALSSSNDPRITPVGRFLRKSHLDEIPQFWNVIIGQMSLVGPRPERRFYIDQLLERAPEYTLLHKVRPGITSWGQVKYGYASNLEQMLERLPYDLVYLKNASLYLDFKIMIFSIIEICTGKGK